MSVPTLFFSAKKLAKLGLTHAENIHYQSPPDALIKDTLRRGEGRLSDSGALVIETGAFTGRSPEDKFTVRDDITEHTVDWNNFNIPIEEVHFHTIRKRLMAYLESQPEIWVRDAYVCADPRYRLNVRVVCEKPWTALFAHNMFLRPGDAELEHFEPEWHLYSAPDLKLDSKECGIRQSNATVVSFKHKTILIVGTGYTGETKKGVFSILNYILPQEKGVLSMHCSANIGAQGDTAIFFGLSGTGKTTLSADPERKLIGDDEHGWSDTGVFNFEGGCYAKLINLSEAREPQIFRAVRYGALAENVRFFPGTNTINFADGSITPNTRVSYPLHFIPNAVEPSIGGIPKNIFFLTCDSFGVLPPIARLTPGQAMYQFISGYTAKVAGTETGVREPKPTFSACFGAPFLPLHPGKYAAMLGTKMQQHQTRVWLVNTGWTGGPYSVGSRINLDYTRAMVAAALNDTLDNVITETDPVFHFAIPMAVPGVPDAVLNPRNTWANNEAYDRQARYVAQLFIANFEQYASGVSAETKAAAPNV